MDAFDQWCSANFLTRGGGLKTLQNYVLSSPFLQLALDISTFQATFQ